MACFVAPVTEAVVTTVMAKVVKSKENKEALRNVHMEESSFNNKKIAFSTKLGWLNKMLWGGSALLAFEHIWHGEVIATFPFLTAIKSGEALGMLKEIGTTGVGMAVLVTAVWGVMLIVSSALEKRAANDVNLAKEAN